MSPQNFGAYTLLRRIAIGGTAEIFLARRHGVDGFARHLAIKRILPHHADDPDFVQLLLDEARLAAHLHHGHIVEIHEVGVEADQAYIAMEYLPGTDLGRLMRAARERRRTLLVVVAHAGRRAALAQALAGRGTVLVADTLAEAERQASGDVDLALIDDSLLSATRDPFLHRLQSAHPELLRTLILAEHAGRGGPHVRVAAPELETLLPLVDTLLAPALPLELALQVVRAVTDALAYAHAAQDFDGQPLQIVHRDINPSNVLVSVSGTVKLVDFGIARATTSRPGPEGAFAGTFHYMSPEQARGKAVDARSDVFSLGILLHELVAGVHPFKRDDQFGTLRAIREHVVPPLTQLNPGVPAALSDLVQRALSKTPEDRPADGGALLAVLEDVLGKEGFNLSPRRLEGFMRASFSAEKLLDFGVTTTGTQPRIFLPAVAAAPPTPPPLPQAPPPPTALVEVEVDLADLEVDLADLADLEVDLADLADLADLEVEAADLDVPNRRPATLAWPEATHPIERMSTAEAPRPTPLRGDFALRVTLVAAVLALLALGLWYWSWRSHQVAVPDSAVEQGP